jgi:hypothetical protein
MLASLDTGLGSTLLIANVYAPVEAKENHKFWGLLDAEIKAAVTLLRGKKITKLIAGDFNTTLKRQEHLSFTGTHPWVNKCIPTCLEMIRKNKMADAVKHIYGKEKVYTREVPYSKPHPTREFITRSRIDHFLLSKGKINTVISGGVENSLATYSDHHGVLVRLKANLITKKVGKPHTNPLRAPRLNTRNGLSVQDAKVRIKDAMQSPEVAASLASLNSNTSVEDIEKTIHKALAKPLGTVTPSPNKSYRIDSPALKKIRRTKKKVAETLAAVRNPNGRTHWKLINVMEATYKMAESTMQMSPQLLEAKPPAQELDRAAKWLVEVRTALAKEQAKEVRVANVERIKKAVEDNAHLMHTNPRLFNRKIMGLLLAKGPSPIKDPLTNVLTVDPQKKANINKNFWKSTFTSIRGPANPNNWPANNNIYKQINWGKEFTLEDFDQAIGRMFSAPGPDGIPVEVVKALPASTKTLLLEYMNKAYKEGLELPKSWRTSMLSLLPKTSDPVNPGDYRPIALLTVISKVYTGLLTARLTEYTEKNGILHPCQYGARPGKSTAHAITHLISILEDAKQFKKKAYICSLDVAKAFDSVEYEAIFNALKYYQVPEVYVSAIKQIYKDNLCFIASPEGDSASFQPTRGVRQGDTLSPLLFALVII